MPKWGELLLRPTPLRHITEVSCDVKGESVGHSALKFGGSAVNYSAANPRNEPPCLRKEGGDLSAAMHRNFSAFLTTPTSQSSTV